MILSIISACLHLAGFAWMISVAAAIGVGVNEGCITTICGNDAWQSMTCNAQDYANIALCTSEQQCRDDSYLTEACRSGASLLAGWITAIAWPGIIFSIACLIVQIIFAVKSKQARFLTPRFPPPSLFNPAPHLCPTPPFHRRPTRWRSHIRRSRSPPLSRRSL